MQQQMEGTPFDDPIFADFPGQTLPSLNSTLLQKNANGDSGRGVHSIQVRFLNDNTKPSPFNYLTSWSTFFCFVNHKCDFYQFEIFKCLFSTISYFFNNFFSIIFEI